MPKIRISKSNVDLVQPGDLDKMFWDDKLAGFGLKVTPAGRKVYLYRYRIAGPGKASVTPMVTFTIGTHGNLTPEQAKQLVDGFCADRYRLLVDGHGLVASCWIVAIAVAVVVLIEPPPARAGSVHDLAQPALVILGHAGDFLLGHVADFVLFLRRHGHSPV